MNSRILISRLCITFFFLPCILLAQEYLDEMELIDISKEQQIRSTIIRDPDQALLIVQTHIPNLRFQSNNVIHKIEQPRSGTWQIRLAPGTHRMSFQADGFMATQKRYYFNPKQVIGVKIRVIPSAERQ